MRPLRALGIYMGIVFIGGALLAPWIYWLVHSLAHVFPNIAQPAFHRYVSNTMLLVAVLGFWPLFRSLGATSLREIGLPNPIEHWKKLMGGVLVGLVSMAVVGLLAVAFGARQFNYDHSAARLANTLLSTMLTAALVAFLEEILFRGGMFGGLRRVFRWPFALVLSSMIYSLVHFLQDASAGGTITWVSGLELLPQMFGALTNWTEAAPRFLNLTLVGVLLGVAYQRTENLWFSIGLHAGWIFWLMSYRLFTMRTPGASSWLWGTRKMIDGWMVLPTLALTLVLLMRFLPEQKTISANDKHRDGVHST